MGIPVCQKCGRPLHDARSIQRGYGPKCARDCDDELRTGLQVLSQMCFVMNTQAHSAAMLPEYKIKITTKPEERQIDFLEDLFNEQN